MDELDLYAALTQGRAKDFFPKTAGVRDAVRRHPHVSAAALGAALGAGLTLAREKTRHKKAVRDSAFKGALVGGGSSLAMEALTKRAAPDWARAKDLGRRMYQANKPEIIGGAIAGALGAAAGYGMSKRWKKGQPSLGELEASDYLAGQDRSREKLRGKGKDPGFTHKIQDVLARGYEDFAKVLAEHPVHGALLYGAALAPLGSNVARSWA